MNLRVVNRAVETYARRMRTFALRLLTLIALVLMPFGMSAAPAASVDHQGMAMPVQHCPEPPSKPLSTGLVAQCSMACASALPAAELEPLASQPAQPLVLRPSAQRALPAIALEIDTPPPRAG